MATLIANDYQQQSSLRSPSSPRSPENEKSKKYDRQLRLWGEHGQYKLESSHVCLINATATGTEILKSLVLPGVGAFTIIDANPITGEDVGCNFFLCCGTGVGGDFLIGKQRGKVATDLLLEMNSDVRGDFIDDNLDALIDTHPQFFSARKISVVIATGLINEQTMVKLTNLLWKANIPLLICKSYGFIGVIRLQIREHTIVESHPDNQLDDLRLDAPFNELKNHLDGIEPFESMSRKDVGHIPYLIVIYKYLQKWREENGKGSTDLPKTFKEKESLRQLIRQGMETIKTSIAQSEDEATKELELENFEEAIQAVNKVLNPSNYIPRETKKILDDEKSNDSKSVSSFWLLIRALKQFVAQNDGCLPVRGAIPDMTSDSAKYIHLQKIYAAKANRDAESLFSILQRISNDIGRSCDGITENEVKLFCKNAHCLRVVRTSPLSAEYSGDLRNIKGLVNDDGDSELIYYLLLRSVDRFYSQFNRVPGYCKDQVESDVSKLKTCFRELLNELGCSTLSKDDFIHEICRYGGAELHSVASFIGGCAAQEVIKLVTGQYVPFNNTFVYNAIASTSATYEL